MLPRSTVYGILFLEIHCGLGGGDAHYPRRLGLVHHGRLRADRESLLVGELSGPELDLRLRFAGGNAFAGEDGNMHHKGIASPMDDNGETVQAR